MAGPSSLQRWRLAAGLTVLVLVALLALVFARKAPRQEPTDPAPPTARTRPTAMEAGDCGIPPLTSVRALPDAEGPPVLLWATGDVRLYVDDKAAFSSPEAPRHLAVGEHAVRVEAKGHPPYEIRVRIEPWTPALLHAELDPQAGLTLARLEALCVACPHALEPHARIATRDRTSAAPLAEAAEALRRNNWLQAMTFLEQVPRAERGSRAFQRLASTVYADTNAPVAADRALRAIGDADLRALLVARHQLSAAEQGRRHDVQLARWNRTTERFSALVESFGKELPQAVGSASERLEALSPIFEQAHAAKELLDAEEALQAAEAELLTLINRLRAARPGDCVFQAGIVRTITG